MEKKYITDTDFLPVELTHYHGLYTNEMTDDLYQIVYGIFQPSHTLSDVYEVVLRIVSKQKNPAIRKFKLMSWKKDIESIVKILGKLNPKDSEVIVYVPLRGCELSLSAAISYFQLAIFTIDELANSETTPAPAFPNEPLIPDLKGLFEESYSDILSMLDDYDPEIDEMGSGDDNYWQHAKYWQSVILDEMYRRGIETVKMKEETPILPSEYYGDTTLYKQTFIENGSQLVLDSGSDVVSSFDAPESQTVYDNDTIGTRAAVMYYMLSSFCPITDDNFNRAVAMIDFAVGKQSPKFNVNKANDTEINKVNNKNSIKKYVRNCRDNRKYLEEPGSQKVRERLPNQGFDTPTPEDSSTKRKPF
jgi:hypothetical protein